ncbi:MAG: hypothetical protein LBE72_05320 [Rickettsia sp.]|jgi:hypothetical protein|nr:hypothetical protein [Rickettsia sp.]
MKNYKKMLILLILFVAVASINISDVSAEKFKAYCNGGSVDHEINWTKKLDQKVFSGDVIKKKGEYYKEIQHIYLFTQDTCFHETHNKKYWPNGYGYSTLSILDPRSAYDDSDDLKKHMKIDYMKVKKGEVLDKSTPKYWKTIESKGKIQKVYKITKTVAVNSKTLKKVTDTTVKTVGYYKTINFKKEGPTNNVKLGHGDYCAVHHGYQYRGYKEFTVGIYKKSNPLDGDPYYNQIKTKVYFKQSNGKTVIKTYKGGWVQKKLPNGYKPIKAIIYYQKN